LSLPINDGYADNDANIKEMTGAILNDMSFAGKIVLILENLAMTQCQKRPQMALLKIENIP
jgi:hypothetical protein